MTKMNAMNFMLKNGFNGVTVVGDIHGIIEALDWAAVEAERNGNLLISLGDLVDYGPDSDKVIDSFYRQLWSKKLALMVIGNHENKYYRYLKAMRETGTSKVVMSPSLKSTVDAIARNPRGKLIEDEFLELYERSSYGIQIGTTLFAHAAIHVDMWQADNWDKRQQARALYGQVDPKNPVDKETGFPNRLHQWADEVPFGHNVVVGHQIMNKDFTHKVTSGRQGGTTFYLDTGSAKNGSASLMNMTFDGKNLIPGEIKKF